MRPTLFIAMISMALAACSYEASFSDCTVVCSPASGCPAPLECSFTSSMTEGLCRAADVTETCASILGANFLPAVDLATGTNPTTVAIGDLNGDDKPDVAVVNYASTSVSIFLNTTATGATTPSFTPKSDFQTGSGPRFLAIGDFNGDGKPDVAVANQIAATVAVLLNTTETGAMTPSFSAEVEFPTGSGVPSVAVGDINGDGKPDLVVSDSHSGTVSVLLNTAVSGAAVPSFATTFDLTVGPQDSGLYVAIGDINADGKPDIVVTDHGSKTASVFVNATAPNATTPSFAASSDLPMPSGPGALAIGDLNGDGKPDLAVANYDVATVSVLLNSTATGATIPSFGAEADFTTSSGNPSIAIGDLTGDDKPDLAVTGSNAGLAALVNTTATGSMTPSFAAGIDFTTEPQPGFIAIDDLNGDGKPDLAIVVFANAVSILLAQ